MGRPTTQSLQNQIMDLKAEIVELSALVSDHGKDVRRNAAPALDTSADILAELADYLSGKGKDYLNALVKHPGKVKSIALAAGVGLAGIYLLGKIAPYRK